MYKPSEKCQVLSAPQKDFGPFWRASQRTHEIERCKAILRNPQATAEDKAIATQRLFEFV